MIDNTTSLRGAYEGIRTAGFTGARDEVRNLAGRAIDADNLLSQSNMSPGLRDWDLWGPLVFCLMLSMLLSFRSRPDQRSVVFSGVFAMIWLGEAVVTTQIKLLGGNMCVKISSLEGRELIMDNLQLICTVYLYYWIHSVPSCHCGIILGRRNQQVRSNTNLSCPSGLVTGSWCQYPWWEWGRQKQSRYCCISIICLLYWSWMLMLH
mgnify:CR=1 FL=1